MVLLHVRQHAGRIGGCRGHEEMIFAEARGRAVVVNHAVFAQHDAVTRLTDRQFQPVVDIQAIQELGRIGTLDVDLAERGDVDQRDIVARGLGFTHVAVVQGITGVLRKVARPQPQAGLDKNRALFFVPVVNRGAAYRHEVVTDGVPGKHAHRHRHVGWSKGSNADLGYRFAALAGQDSERVDVTGLALVGCHALGSVTLQQLDRVVTFLRGELDIAGLDIVLLVDELLV